MGKQPDENLDIIFQIQIEEDFKLIRKLLNNIEEIRNLASPENDREAQRILNESIDISLDRMNAQVKPLRKGGAPNIRTDNS